jgi:hypothetical protein
MFGLETVYPREKLTWRHALAVPLMLLMVPLVVLFVPLAFLVSKLLSSSPALPDQQAAEEFVEGLRGGFLSLGMDDDWEQLIETGVADEELDSIRARAAALDLPLKASGLGSLRQLISEAEDILQKREGSS